jgi:hypothetical protein
MGTLHHLSTLALRQTLDGACRAMGVAAAEEVLDRVVAFLAARFTDHSLRLGRALGRANSQTWKAVEIALAGESLWNLLDAAEHKAFRQQIRQFLDTTPLYGLAGHGPEFRQQCLRELRAAQKAGSLQAAYDPSDLAQHVGAFARFGDPQSLIEEEWRILDRLADELMRLSYPTVAHFVAVRPPQGPAVVVAGVRYFFRREVETDRELFQGLTWAELDAIQKAQEYGFASLADVLAQQTEHLDGALDRIHDVVTQTHGAVQDVKGMQQLHGQQLDQIYQAILDLKRKQEEQGRAVQSSAPVKEEEIRPWWKTVPSFGEDFATWHVFDPQSEEVLCDAVSADGRRALTGHADTTVHLWDLATGKERVCLLGHLDKVYSVAFVGAAQALSSGTDKTVRLWDLAKGRELQVFEGKTNRSMAVSADGRLVLTGSLTDGMVRLWDLKTGRELRRFKGHMSWVLGLLFLDGDKRAVSCSADRTIRLWEVATGRELKRYSGHGDQVFSVAVSRDGRQIASASLDGTARVWDALRGTEIRRDALTFTR